MSEQNLVEDRQFSQFITAIKNGYQSSESVPWKQLKTSSETVLLLQSIASNLSSENLLSILLLLVAKMNSHLTSSNYQYVTEPTSVSKIIMSRVSSSTSAEKVQVMQQRYEQSKEGKEKCAELLLSHGLSLDDVDVYGQTPLFYAVSENRINIVSKYATKDRVNHVDKLAKQSPLYYAARRGHLNMASLLLQRGADITLQDSYNKTVVQYARKAKFVELTDFLNGELRKVKDLNKSEEPERKAIPRRKDEVVKEARHTYKLVHLNEKGESRDLTQEEVKQIVANNPELASYLANPETIPQDTNQDSWDNAASRVLNYCSKIKGAFYFQEPVDPVKYNIMDYFDIITHPMDLGTVRKRLSHNFYQTPHQFVKDMNLIWNNSYQYNGPQHIVSKSGRELEETFSQQIVSQGLDKYLSVPSDNQEVKDAQAVYRSQEEDDKKEKEEGREERKGMFDSARKEGFNGVGVRSQDQNINGNEENSESEEGKQHEDEYNSDENQYSE